MAFDAAFNDTIHAPLRLRICGLLRAVDALDFAVLRDSLGISDANLSKQLKVLADAGLVTTTKGASALWSDARRVAWVSLTADGRAAFDGHVAALQAIAGGFDVDSTGQPVGPGANPASSRHEVNSEGAHAPRPWPSR